MKGICAPNARHDGHILKMAVTALLRQTGQSCGWLVISHSTTLSEFWLFIINRDKGCVLVPPVSYMTLPDDHGCHRHSGYCFTALAVLPTLPSAGCQQNTEYQVRAKDRHAAGYPRRRLHILCRLHVLCSHSQHASPKGLPWQALKRKSVGSPALLQQVRIPAMVHVAVNWLYDPRFKFITEIFIALVTVLLRPAWRRRFYPGPRNDIPVLMSQCSAGLPLFSIARRIFTPIRQSVTARCTPAAGFTGKTFEVTGRDTMLISLSTAIASAVPDGCPLCRCAQNPSVNQGDPVSESRFPAPPGCRF